MLAPASTEEVAEIVRLAAEHRVPLVPQGGNTGMVGGRHAASRRIRAAPVDAPDEPHPLDQRRKPARRRRSGRDPRNLHDAAHEVGMRFPLTLGARGSCTVGGLTSTNAGGTQVLKFGTMRSLVAGLEAVLPDGSIHNGLSGSQEGQSRLQPRPAADRRGRHARGDHCGGAPARARAGGSRCRLGRGREPAARARSASLPRSANQQHRRVRAGPARIAFSSC